jgi:hypothetical protein
LLGSGVQQSGDAGDYSQAGDATTKITNDISVAARSGDAEVSGNGTAGDATSGKAQAGVNLLNITNSQFQLDNWFGVLFINVLGSWLGNFDIQAALQSAGAGDDDSSPVVQDVRVFQFDSDADVEPVAETAATDPQGGDEASAQTTLASAPVSKLETGSGHVLGSSTPIGQSKQSIKLDIFGLGLVVLGLTALIATGTLAIRHWYNA